MIESRITSSALVPLASRDLALLVARGANLDDAEAGERVRIHLLRRDVHPAHVVAVAVADQLGGVVVHPVRIARAERRPLVAGALRESLQVDELVVDVDAAGARAALELRLAEIRSPAVLTSTTFPSTFRMVYTSYRYGSSALQKRASFERAGRGQHALLAVDHVHRVAVELRADLAVVIDDRHRKPTVARSPDSLCTSASTVTSAVFFAMSKLAAWTYTPLALQPVVERQRLVDLARDVQPHMPVDAAVVGIEVVRVPLVPRTQASRPHSSVAAQKARSW